MSTGPERVGVAPPHGDLPGDELVKLLSTLANPHRMRVIAALLGGRNYVSRLARDLRISRALLQMHLRKLEAVGLVRSQLEISDDGKAMKYYEVVPFVLSLTPETIAAASLTCSFSPDSSSDTC